MDFRRVLVILRLQAGLLLGLTLALLALFLFIPQLGTVTEYVSTAKILLTPPRTAVGEDGHAGDTANWLADQDTLQELITSERLLERVRQICLVREEWQELRERIHIEPLTSNSRGKVDLFLIAVRDPSPKQSQKIAETVVQEFTSYVEELSAREFANTRRFLEELVAESDDKINKAEEALLEITSARVDANQAQSMVESLVELEADKRKAREEVALLEAELESVHSFLSSPDSSVAPSVLMQTTETGLGQSEAAVVAARMKLLELEQMFTDRNVQVLAQRAKVQKLQQNYREMLTQRANKISTERSLALNAKRGFLRSVEEKLSELRHQQLTPAERRQVAKLERQLSMWEENTLNLTKQLYQARVVEQSSRRQGAITMLEKPGPGLLAKAKKSRSLAVRIALGIPFCVVMAVVLVLGWDLLNASLRLLPKIEASLGVPVFAIIPQTDGELVELWEAFKRDKDVGESSLQLLDDESSSEQAGPSTVSSRDSID